MVQQTQGEEIQLLLEKVIERVKETPAGNIQVRHEEMGFYGHVSSCSVSLLYLVSLDVMIFSMAA